jgi:hypothetical protein
MRTRRTSSASYPSERPGSSLGRSRTLPIGDGKRSA